MPDYTPTPIASEPGCQRDGTPFDGSAYQDNQWVRYWGRKGRPRKIGGMRVLTNQLPESCRGMTVFNQNDSTYTHAGSASYLTRLTLDQFGNASATTDRTPAAFVADADNLWQFSTLYDGGGTMTTLLAHAAPNLSDISSDTVGEVWYGDVTGTGVLVVSGANAVSGGVMTIGPYAVAYGSAGIVQVSAANDPTTFPNSFRPTASKIVYGQVLRAGAGNGPSALLWSLDSLVRMTFVGGATIFNFDTISGQYSILSSQAVIEHDGVFYWPGIDSFKMYNGVIQELENTMNSDYFFDNLNYTYRQKVFATKITRWGEIWFCYPRGDATECSHAVIYNYRLSRRLGMNVWYDTELPAGYRSAAQFAQVFKSPLMTGTDVDAISGLYSLWQHEYGVDVLDSAKRVNAIRAFFETTNISQTAPMNGGSGKNAGIYCEAVQPDFIQTGEMTYELRGQGNPRAPEDNSTTWTFQDTAATSEEQYIWTRGSRRQMSHYFESNIAGGNFAMGNTLAYLGDAPGKMTA